MREKCQKCSKQATYHITDIESGQVREHHFCDEHARQHLAPSEEPEAAAPEPAPKARPGREPEAEKKVCPHCQITFQEFRSTGRLGCAHDYEVFRDDLLPLLENIHDATRHGGKAPRRAPRTTERQTELLDLRKRLKHAIGVEDYELAARLRDEIKAIEQRRPEA
jgi:protein arginine kinase activator